jgi:hypothetical protein
MASCPSADEPRQRDYDHGEQAEYRTHHNGRATARHWILAKQGKKAARIVRDQERDFLAVCCKLRKGAIKDGFFPTCTRDL